MNGPLENQMVGPENGSRPRKGTAAVAISGRSHTYYLFLSIQ